MRFPSTLIAAVLLMLIRPSLARGVQVQTASTNNASASSPAGRWKTFDDVTGRAKSIVAIREDHGKLYGTIETLFDPPVPHPTCYLCSGAMKDQPLVGLQVLWGFQRDGNQWSGGHVLDPETGRIYRSTITLENGGMRLRLHGYIGIPLFGRTQHWARVE